MLGSTGVEVFGIIDPQLNWNTDSKGKQRAPRRPRASFNIEHKKKVLLKDLKETGDHTNKDLNTREISVLESEKFGVTILGHHFDGSIEGVPIKKRFLLGHSPVPSQCSPPSRSEESDISLESKGSHQLIAKQPLEPVSSDTLCEGADFSGISILAAAACNSRLCGDIMNSEVSASKGQEHVALCGVLRNAESKGEELNKTAGVSDGGDDVQVVQTISALPAKGEDESRTRDSRIQVNANESLGKIQTSLPSKLHWDLNKEMDAWEYPNDYYEDPPCDLNEVDAHEESLHKPEIKLDPVAHDCAECVKEPVGVIISHHTPEDIQRCMNSEISKNLNMSHSISSIDHLPVTSDDSSQTESHHSFEAGAAIRASDRSNPHPPHEERADFLVVDSARDDTTLNRSYKDENDATPTIDPTTCKSAHSVLCGSSPGMVCCDELAKVSETAENRCDDLSANVAESPHLSDPHDSKPNAPVICEDTHSSSCKMEVWEKCIESNIQGHGICAQSDHGTNPTNIDCNDQNPSMVCKNDISNKATDDASSLVNTAILGEKCKSSSNVVMESHGEECLQNIDCDYESDTFEDDDGQPIGMEKVDLYGDDDSQYEDGEFRESILHNWETDGGEDGETEQVDYGSDNGDADAFDNPVPAISPNTEGAECNVDELLEGGCIHLTEDRANKGNAELNSKASSQCLKIAVDIGRSNIGKEDRRGQNKRKDRRGVETVVKDAACSLARKGFRDGNHYVKVDDGAKQSDNSAALRVKSSGWDHQAEGSKIIADSGVDVGSGNKRSPSDLADKFSAGGLQRRANGSGQKNDVSLRMARPTSPEISCRKDGSYYHKSRVNKLDGSNHPIGKDDSCARLVRKGGSSMHMHDREGRDDSWDESQGQWVRAPHDPPGYCGSSGFAHASSKTALEATAAKVESKGFVVAPDGTVVEPSHLKSTGLSSRRNQNFCSQATHRSLAQRTSPIERDESLTVGGRLEFRPTRNISPRRHTDAGQDQPGRSRSRIFTTDRWDRRNGPLSGENIGSHPFYRRERSFSPQRGSFNIRGRHTESRSRSRTRSPHAWTSPRRKGDNRTNGGPGFRRCIRSPPQFRSDDRIGRRRSPPRRADFMEQITDCVPLSRSRVPHHPSKWIQERNIVHDPVRGPEYRQSSGRNPPAKLPFSRSDEFEPSGRAKAEDYHWQMHNDRFNEFLAVGKRQRFNEDEEEDRRGRNNGYETLAPPSRQYEFVGKIKRFRYGGADGFRIDTSRYKSDREFDERGTPRGFERGNDSLENSSGRTSEDKSHYRYNRAGRNTSLKATGT